MTITTQTNPVKKESTLVDENNEECITKPVSSKVAATSGSFTESPSSTDLPITVKNENKHDTSPTVSPRPLSIPSGAKVYANLESAMPVAGTSPQSPISIQTIEVQNSIQSLFNKHTYHKT